MAVNKCNTIDLRKGEPSKQDDVDVSLVGN